jgi:hypothetical protein
VDLTTLELRTSLMAGFHIMDVASSGFAARVLVTVHVDA